MMQRGPCQAHAIDVDLTMPPLVLLLLSSLYKPPLLSWDSTTPPHSLPLSLLEPPSLPPCLTPEPRARHGHRRHPSKTAQIFITIAIEPYTKVVALENTFPTHLTTPQSELRGERYGPRKLAASGGRRRPSAVGSSSDDLCVPRVPDVHAPCMRGPGRSWAGPTTFPPSILVQIRFIYFL
jgi:hypothetical protein